MCVCSDRRVVFFPRARGAQVPDGAVPGERVGFPGAPNDGADAATPAQAQKKKIWEKTQPLFKTDAKGACLCADFPFTLKAGPCTAPLPNATIS